MLAALLLPAGALGDRFGRRTALLVGIVIFVIASGAAAMMTDAGALIAWRGVAGIGAALIMPGTLATITSVFPAEERARAVGVWAGFAGGGAILGTIVAGVLLEFFWWGSIFLLVAVVAVVAFVATVLTTPNTKNPEEANLDPPGAVLSAVAIGGLVLGIIEGPARGWTDALTLAGLGVGIVAGVVFVLWELRARRPLLDPRLFTNRGFATSTTALAMLFLTMFGFFFVVLQFLQLQLGLSPLEASLAVLPLAVTMFPLSTISAVAGERYGMRVVATVGLVSTAIAFGYLTTLNEDSGYLALVPGLLISGAGIALAMGPATNQIVSSLPAAKQGVASAVNDTARELGVALGVAVLGSAFNAGYRNDIDTVAGRAPSAPRGAREGLARDSPCRVGAARPGGFRDRRRCACRLRGGHAMVDAARHRHPRVDRGVRVVEGARSLQRCGGPGVTVAGWALVVGVDGSSGGRQALRVAVELGAATAARLVFVYVRHDQASLAASAQATLEHHRALDEIAVHIEAELTDALAEYSREWTFVQPHGDPAGVLGQLAVEHQAWAIVVGHRGHGALVDAMVGSTAQALMNRSPVTLIVARADAPH